MAVVVLNNDSAAVPARHVSRSRTSEETVTDRNTTFWSKVIPRSIVPLWWVSGTNVLTASFVRFGAGATDVRSAFYLGPVLSITQNATGFGLLNAAPNEAVGAQRTDYIRETRIRISYNSGGSTGAAAERSVKTYYLYYTTDPGYFSTPPITLSRAIEASYGAATTASSCWSWVTTAGDPLAKFIGSEQPYAVSIQSPATAASTVQARFTHTAPAGYGVYWLGCVESNCESGVLAAYTQILDVDVTMLLGLDPN